MRSQKKHLEKHFWPILPLRIALGPSKNQKGPPLWWKIRNFSDSWCYSSKEAYWFTEWKKTTSALCKVPILKKSRKIAKNGHFWKNGQFWQFSLIFSETALHYELRLFRYIQCIKTVLLSYQNQLSYNFSDFSPLGETLLILGGSERYAQGKGKDWSNMVFKTFFLGP